MSSLVIALNDLFLLYFKNVYKILYKISYSSEENALTIVNYILAMKTEINPSDNYRKDNIKLLYILKIGNRYKKMFSVMLRCL